MPDFRIAGGYVEVTTRVDQSQTRAAARAAGAEVDAEMAAAGDKGGRSFSDRFAAATTGTGAAEGGRIAQTLEQTLGAGGTTAGDSFTRGVDGRLRDSRGRFVSTGQSLGEDIGETIIRGADGRLRDSRGRFVSTGRQLGDGLSQGLRDSEQEVGGVGDRLGRSLLTRIAESLDSGANRAFGKIVSGAQDMVKNIGSSIASGLGNIALLFAKWGTIALAGIEVIPPVLTAIEGGLASIPALAIGAAGAIGMLGLGFHGIGAAIGEVFNPPRGGGGGSSANDEANRADQIASAERSLTLAQRSAADAQTALNDARRQAVNDLADMNLQLARAHLDEQGAILAVKQAQIDLMNAQNTQQDPLAQERAKQNLLEAQQALVEARQHTKELQEQTAEANAKGVEGSDKVKAALEQQQSAVFQVADAQAALRRANEQTAVSAGGAVSALSKLAPNARAFVEEIARLKPQLLDLQRYVQNELFAGMDRKLAEWAGVWIPTLKTGLGGLADAANQFAKRLGDDLSKPEVRQAVDGVFASMDRVLTKFTTGGSLDKLVHGFNDLVVAATPFVEKLGNKIVDELGKLGDWLSDKKKSGALAQFFEDAYHDAQDLWDIGKDVFAIVSDIVNIATGQDKKKNGNALDSFKDTMDNVRSWIESDKGKKTIKQVIDDFHEIAVSAVHITEAVAKVIGWFTSMKKSGKELDDDLSGGFKRVSDDLKFGFLTAELFILQSFDNILTGADKAFSWIPGIGGKLKNAKGQFDVWVGQVNSDLDKLVRTREATVKVNVVPGASVGGALGALFNHRYGGVDYAFASGGVMSAGIYDGRAAGRPLVRFAEPEAGGELYMPHNSPDINRQQAIASVAAGWADGQFIPNHGGITTVGSATAPQPQVIHVHNYLDGKEIGQGLVLDPRRISTATAQGNRRRAFTDVRARATG